MATSMAYLMPISNHRGLAAESICWTITAVVILIVLNSLRAVSAQSIEIGDRVRVRIPGNQYTGSVTAIDTKNFQLDLTIGSSLSLVDVVKADMEKLEVSRGQRRQTWLGLGFGVALGAGSAALVAHLKTKDDGCFDSARSEDCVKAAAVAGGLIGGLLGALIGTAVKVDQWEVVTVSQASLRVGPGRRGELATIALRL